MLKILNSKEARKIINMLKNQWGAEISLDYGFLQNSKNRVFIINKEVGNIEFEKLRINSAGLYFGEIIEVEIRLSIEGSQIVGPHSEKNVAEVSEEEMKVWLRGDDIHSQQGIEGFVLIRCGKDFLGCGRVSGRMIKNFVPKTRRIKAADQP